MSMDVDRLRSPECKVFVDADLPDTQLISMTAPVLFAPDDDLMLEVEVLNNEDYDSNRRRQFPDGFIYFRYTLDLYMSEAPVRRQAAIVTRLMETLWDSGFPAVAACAFEERLPERGGYKSHAVPWPR